MLGNRWLPVACTCAALVLLALAAAHGYAWQMIWLPAAVAGAAWPHHHRGRRASAQKQVFCAAVLDAAPTVRRPAGPQDRRHLLEPLPVSEAVGRRVVLEPEPVQLLFELDPSRFRDNSSTASSDACCTTGSGSSSRNDFSTSIGVSPFSSQSSSKYTLIRSASGCRCQSLVAGSDTKRRRCTRTFRLAP